MDKNENVVYSDLLEHLKVFSGRARLNAKIVRLQGNLRPARETRRL